MTIQHRTGDIFTAADYLTIIGHGVNMKGIMGSGIARTVKDKYPSVFEDYKRAIRSGVLQPGSVRISPALEHPKLFIANISSQIEMGANADLHLLEAGLRRLLLTMELDYETHQVALPRIGAGIGGLDWDTQVLPLIERLDEEMGGRFQIELWTYDR